jgi:general secretion pathway protein G
MRRTEIMLVPQPTPAGRRAGFTLIELLVVLVILGLLASIVAPNVMSRLGGAKVKTARVQIEDLGAALDLYMLETGALPGTDDGLAALVQKPSNAERWNGPYLKKANVPKDPWGNEYHYQSPGEHGPYDLYSLGADNAPGGEDDNADIGSWN